MFHFFLYVYIYFSLFLATISFFFFFILIIKEFDLIYVVCLPDGPTGTAQRPGLEGVCPTTHATILTSNKNPPRRRFVTSSPP